MTFGPLKDFFFLSSPQTDTVELRSKKKEIIIIIAALRVIESCQTPACPLPHPPSRKAPPPAPPPPPRRPPPPQKAETDSQTDREVPENANTLD